MRKILPALMIPLALSGCNNTQPETPAPPTAVAAKDSFYLVDDTVTYTNYGLNAIHNGQVIRIVDTSEQLYIRIESVLDYDHDNDMDALILYSESAGGNCCPSNYFLVTNDGNGRFIRSEMTEPTWEPPLWETRDGKPGFVIKSNNDGMNNDDYEETVFRYIVHNGKIEIAEAVKQQETPALAEIRAKEFSPDKEDEIKNLVFDLDNDQINDTIQCSFWSRWGRMLPKFIFSTGLRDSSSDISSKRIGVLPSQTNGVHDLVSDLHDTMRWNGGAYE